MNFFKFYAIFYICAFSNLLIVCSSITSRAGRFEEAPLAQAANGDQKPPISPRRSLFGKPFGPAKISSVQENPGSPPALRIDVGDRSFDSLSPAERSLSGQPQQAASNPIQINPLFTQTTTVTATIAAVTSPRSNIPSVLSGDQVASIFRPNILERDALEKGSPQQILTLNAAYCLSGNSQTYIIVYNPTQMCTRFTAFAIDRHNKDKPFTFNDFYDQRNAKEWVALQLQKESSCCCAVQ